MSSTDPPIITPQSPPPSVSRPTTSCPHLLHLRSQIGSNPFHRLRGNIRVPLPGRASVHLASNVRCASCGKSSLRLYACVSCLAVACLAHAPAHAEETAHHVAVDVNRAELFCCACGDQVYDRDFDAVVFDVALENSPITPQGNVRKRRHVDYKPWTHELPLIEGKPLPLPLVQPGGDSSQPALPRGLRGLNNLGNTCFMNSILQALLHIPPLMIYFLGDRHNRSYCERENRTIVTRRSDANKGDTSKAPKHCLACDLDAIFSAVFSEEDQMPCSPAKFLYSWWQHASDLASYEQQDAHEFYISILDGIHEKLKKNRRKSSLSQGPPV